MAAVLCLIAAAVIVIAAGMPPRSTGVTRYLIGQTPVAAEVGAQAPPIEIFDVTGKRFSLDALRGHPVILNFWATWCGPCITEMPMLQAFYQQHQAEGLRMVGVDVGENAADVLNWTRHFGLTYDFVVDGEGHLSFRYMIRGMPTTFFIDSAGAVRQINEGPLQTGQLVSALQSLH